MASISFPNSAISLKDLVLFSLVWKKMANNMSFPNSAISLKDLVDRGITSVPSNYVFPSRQSQNDAVAKSCKPLKTAPPVIDLAPLHTSNRQRTVAEIADACRDWGFFHVTNHGVPSSSIKNLLSAADQFFSLPSEERLQYYLEDPRNLRENSVNWKETIACSSERMSPPLVLEPALKYKSSVMVLARNLYDAIFESLGVQVDEDKVKEHMAFYDMLMHYYPPCPDPSLTFGLSEHTDAAFITILLQDKVGGLEILKDNEWIRCDPVENALTINIADQLQILSNGRYSSVIHRVQTNSEKSRISVACFVAPLNEAKIGPLPELIGEQSPAIYKEVSFGEYMQNSLKVRFAESAPSGIDFAKI